MSSCKIRAFYRARARAPEYGKWWQRRRRYERGHHEIEEWCRHAAAVEAALAAFAATGDAVRWVERRARIAGCDNGD